MERYAGDDIDAVILEGITFKPRREQPQQAQGKGVKTKAKKKAYVTGAHGSASAKKKADIRTRRANRPSQKK